MASWNITIFTRRYTFKLVDSFHCNVDFRGFDQSESISTSSNFEVYAPVIPLEIPETKIHKMPLESLAFGEDETIDGRNPANHLGCIQPCK